MFGKYLTACASALLCVIASFCALTLVLIGMGHPLYRDMPFVEEGYTQGLTLTNVIVMSTYAAENTDLSANANSVRQTIENTIYYDMTQGGTQVFEIKEENGEF